MRMRSAYTRSDCERLRELCIANAREIARGGDVVVMLSGGIDSVTALFSFIAAGVNPKCVNFKFDGYESADTASTIQLCEKTGVELRVVTIPEPSWDDVKDSAVACVKYFGRVRKVKCESWYAMNYAAGVLPEKCVVVSGGNGDALFGYHKNQAIEAARLGDSHELVIKKRYGDKVRDEFLCLGSPSRVYVDFFFDKAICDFVTTFPINAVNKRFPKSFMYYAFESEHTAYSSYRRPRSFVKAGGEDEMFESVASKFGYKTALRMFNAAYREASNGG